MNAQREVDVVVAGSGAAGLAAALAAAAAGRDVLVLEASARWGGTSGVSGGQAWVPDNHRMREAGIEDSFEDALTYCLGVTEGRDRPLIEAFLRAAPGMARFVEEHSPIRFTLMQAPDSFAERPGGKANGRHLEAAPLQFAELGALAELLWPNPYPPVLTNDEVHSHGLIAGGEVPFDLIGRRVEAMALCLGAGLVVGLLRGCLVRGVELVLSCPVRHLLLEDGAVVGVDAERDGSVWQVRARRGVVLACGGFEWDDELSNRLTGRAPAHSVSPPVNHGAAVRLAGEAGAQLDRTAESWFWPVTQVPGERWDDGHPRPRLVIPERTLDRKSVV